MHKVSGWHRLFALAIAIWLIVVAIYAISSLPSAEEERRSRLSVLAYLTPQPFDEGDKVRQDCSPFLRSNELETYKECSRLIYEQGKHFRDQWRERESRTVSEVERDIQGLQALHLAKATGVWLLGSAVLVALGLAVAWVRRGFKQNGA